MTSPRPRRAIFARAFRALACASAVFALGVAGALAQPATSADEPAAFTTDVISVQEIARIQGQGESVLRGIGIVTGLKGTGDPGSELVLARPLAKVYEANGNPLPDLKELAKAKSAAMVWLECKIPSKGARIDDKFDVHITVSHSATSLAGGRLHLAALSGPFPGQGVYAMASGAIVLDDPAIPTGGVIVGGAQVIRDIPMPTINGSFNLILKPAFRHFTVTDQLAETINSLAPEPEPGEEESAAALPALATAEGDDLVRVVIPETERRHPTKFIAKVLSATFSPSLLRLPAQVVVNSRTGSIIVTGNVEISPVAIAHKDMVISTITPQSPPTLQNPKVDTSRWAPMQTTGRQSERTRIQDLINAFRQLDIPINEQINILTDIERTGRLHAELIVE